MASMKRPRLKRISALARHRLVLLFTNDQRMTVDMSRDIERYPGLAPLQDEGLFAEVSMGDDGWTAEWVRADIQIGADTLWFDAQSQAATDENTRIFISWRARTGLPLSEAARALGVSTRSITRYSNARETVPRTLALACLGWEALQQSGQGTLLAEEAATYRCDEP